MAAELIATGTSAAESGDQTVASGATLVLGVKSADDQALAIIELYDGANYIPIRNLTRQDPAWQVVGPATYRVRRVAGGSCGVFSA